MAPRDIPSFLAELRRRHVVRVAIVYGASAFAVLEMVDVFVPALGLGDWITRLAAQLVILGLPVALVLAWAFEITPSGVRRTPSRDGDASPGARRAEPDDEERAGPAWITSRVFAVAAVLVAVGVGAGWLLRPLAGDVVSRLAGPDAATPGSVSDDGYSSLAVLPFADASGSVENRYFGDGLAEELLNALASIQGLDVAARTSAFTFRDGASSVREIGERLGVEAVLEGTVRRSADALRVNVRLVDASTERLIWQDQYDRPVADVLEVQDELARSIVTALALPLGAEQASLLHRGRSRDVEAYERYLLGRQRWASRDVSALWQAIDDFEFALARDSTFALAWSGLADAIDALAWRDSTAVPLVPRAKQAAQRAIALDPELAEGHASLGQILNDFERDWPAAERSLETALRLKPSYADAHTWLDDALQYQGKVEESLVHARIAYDLDPLSLYTATNLAGGLMFARRWDEARRHYQLIEASYDTPASSFASQVAMGRAFGLTSDELADKATRWAAGRGVDSPESAAVIGRAVRDPGARAAAAAELRRLVQQGVPLREAAEVAVAVGEHELALGWLEEAWRRGAPDLLLLGPHPVWDPIACDRRFVRIVKELRVVNRCEGLPG